MRCGRRLSLILSVFCLASLSLWAFPGRGGQEAVAVPAVTMTEETPAAESQKTGSGEASETISTGHRSSLKDSVKEAQGIVDGAVFVGGKGELELVLDAIADKTAAAEKASEAKDAEISDLKARLAAAEEETGTKAYLMLDGIMGFEDMIPQFGVGATIGTRVGNSLMAEIGADYMIGGMDGYNQFDIDNFRFRAGVGWMF